MTGKRLRQSQSGGAPCCRCHVPNAFLLFAHAVTAGPLAFPCVFCAVFAPCRAASATCNLPQNKRRVSPLGQRISRHKCTIINQRIQHCLKTKQFLRGAARASGPTGRPVWHETCIKQGIYSGGINGKQCNRRYVLFLWAPFWCRRMPVCFWKWARYARKTKSMQWSKSFPISACHLAFLYRLFGRLWYGLFVPVATISGDGDELMVHKARR